MRDWDKPCRSPRTLRDGTSDKPLTNQACSATPACTFETIDGQAVGSFPTSSSTACAACERAPPSRRDDREKWEGSESTSKRHEAVLDSLPNHIAVGRLQMSTNVITLGAAVQAGEVHIPSSVLETHACLRTLPTISPSLPLAKSTCSPVHSRLVRNSPNAIRQVVISVPLTWVRRSDSLSI